ncbi:pro-resilin-like [Ctenocephalides felis]|uniref:pro-resilin-like n=1 Tax=Ctenocephalides felis TaxID=7515 RepID=UPI000E6E1DC0|nr:pro-resilin-like [Ctenocephalides felis]
MFTYTLILSAACLAAAVAQVAPGQNAYLPPISGYPSGPRPNQQPFPTRPPYQPNSGFPSGPSSYPGQRPAGPSSYPSGPSGPTSYPSGPSGGGSYPSGPSGGSGDHQHVPGMPFDFAYAVQDAESGNDYSHNAVSDGDVTRGEYRVQLPDGRLQIVRYTADWKNGFNSEVTYEGQAKYPDPPAGGYPGGSGQAAGAGGGYRY